MLYVVIWLALSLVVGWLGKRRAIGFWGFFIASLVFTPVLVLVILAVTQPRPEPRLDRSAS